MIKSLVIKNYRGIRKCVLEDLKRINVFIGRNNSGKSSILESLYLASAAFYFNDDLHGLGNKLNFLLNRRCPRGYTWNTAKEVLWYMYNTKSPISIELFIDEQKNPLVVDLFEWHEHPMIRYKIGNADHICLIHRLMFNSENRAMVGHISDIVFSKETKFFSDFKLIDNALVQKMDTIEKKLWKDLLKERDDRIIVEILRSGYDIDIEDLTYTTYDGKVFQLAVKLPKTTIRVDDLGDGARHAILLMMIASLSKNTALLIEEPENYQHPSGLAKTLDMLLTLVKRNNIQLFITTHSLEFLRILREESKEKKVNVGIYFLERDSLGDVSVRKLTFDNMTILEKMGFDPRFLDLI